MIIKRLRLSSLFLRALNFQKFVEEVSAIFNGINDEAFDEGEVAVRDHFMLAEDEGNF